ncbi:MAG: hypothetical protein HFJ33_08005 [Clostridia bacterium]|uniref:hypothetical protein n=1 Tax=Thomasclavelia cocleata TaxID=69824 RepID=UPI00272E0FB7|nr:hypothetical protein [Thomasclavelia cocleata]MCI8384773.1 hypothetical protein [Clostridia bacterium]
MKKRFYLFLLVVCMTVVLCSCGESSNIVTLDDTSDTTSETVDSSVSSISVYSTRDDKEYLKFLTTFDNTNYKIIDITTGMYTYMNGESYIVTYTKKENDDKTEAVSYKYYLYKTRDQTEYKSFYSSFDFDKYEIVDISTRLYTYMNGESYVITYREVINK